MTLGPLTAGQRADIMRHAPALSPQAKQLFRRLLVVGQEHGLGGEAVAHFARQAHAHSEV